MSDIKAEQKALAILAQAGDRRALDRLLLSMEPYVKVVAARYRRASQMPTEDLRQAARIGILTTIPRYQPNRASFAAACSFYILEEIRKAIDVQRDPLVFPDSRPIKAMKYRLPRIYPTYLALGFSEEVAAEMSAKELGLNPDHVKEFLAARGGVGSYGDDEYFDEGETAFDAVQDSAMKRILGEAMLLLPEKDRAVVRLWSEGCTYVEISARLGMSSKDASMTHRRSMEILTKKLTSDGHTLSDLL